MKIRRRLRIHPSLLSISSTLPTIPHPPFIPIPSHFSPISTTNHLKNPHNPSPQDQGLPLLDSHTSPLTSPSSTSPRYPLKETPQSLSRSTLLSPSPSLFSVFRETSTSLSPKQAHISFFLTNPLQLFSRSKLLSPKLHHLSIFTHNQLQETSQLLTRSAALSSSPFSPFLHNPLQKSPQLAPSAKQPHFSIFLTNPFQETPQFLSRSRASIRHFSSSNTMNHNPSSPIEVNSTLASPFEDSLSSPINASSSIRKPLSLWPGTYHSPVTNALWDARSKIFERLLDPASNDGPPQTELLTKTVSQSRTAILYNFSSDYILREQYRDPWNEVRIGKLLEDLDALAGTIAVKHCADDDSTTRPLLLVTASVDRMVLNKPILVDTDLKISGAVTWVGRSSIEIQMKVAQTQRENSIPFDPIVLTAYFTFVARDSKTGKAAPVSHLLPQTEQEKKLMEEGEARNKLRKKQREEKKRKFETGGHSLRGEVERLETLLAEGRVFCDLPALADRNSILIRDTQLENSLICQPQQRNLHGRIFGGFLMHRAFELAFSTAYAFVGQRPRILEVDHVDFLKPVDVGHFLRFKSCVLYTQLEKPEQPLINIEVVAHVTKPELRTSEVSNTFYFTFTVNPDALKNGLRIRNVVPATEEEARRVLERMDAEEIFS